MSGNGLELPKTNEAEIRALVKAKIEARAAFHAHTRLPDGASIDDQITWEVEEIALRIAAALAARTLDDMLSRK